jgi:hypothetical protein
MAGKIFISYRRDDSADHVHGVAQYLDRQFGRGSVYLDVDMHAGVHFPQELERRLDQSSALLALIDPRWLDSRDDAGRRLENPSDWVRLEIRRALVRGIPVIPVLVGGAAIPSKSDLPSDMQGLLEHQAATVTSRTFRNDMAGLARDLSALRGGHARSLLLPGLAAGAASETKPVDGIVWQNIISAEADDGQLVLRHAFRNGRLRLIPVVKRQYSTRSVARVSLVLQGLWSADNGYGCAEFTFDGNGVRRGNIGVMTPATLDTQVFIDRQP